MTIGIYKLNFSNGAFYIGQSIDIERRFSAHLYTLKNNTSSAKLQKAFEITGLPSLEILVECTEEELDSIEKEAIEIFNATTEGLNSSVGGNHTQSKDGKSCYLLSHELDIYRNILQDLITDTTCKKISEKFNVTLDIVLQISSLKSHSWLAEDLPEEYSILEKINTIGRKVYFSKLANIDIVSPEGPVHIKNLHEFCAGDKVKYTGLYHVIKGIKTSWHGWRLPETKTKEYPILLSPSNVEHMIPYGKAKEFALLNNLNPSSLTRLLRGNITGHKGWSTKPII